MNGLSALPKGNIQENIQDNIQDNIQVLDFFGRIRYLPLESHIHAVQQDYYDAITACHSAGNSNAFILFMLEMIRQALDAAIRQTSEKDASLSMQVQKLLEAMEYGVPYTGVQLMEKLSLKSRDSFRKHYLLPALEKGLVLMTFPDKPTSRKQTYLKKE